MTDRTALRRRSVELSRRPRAERPNFLSLPPALSDGTVAGEIAEPPAGLLATDQEVIDNAR